MGRSLLTVGLYLCSLSIAHASAEPKPRYISAHAYYHALRAELLMLRGESELAREGFRLGLVYDPDSYSLTTRLARTALEQGRSSATMLAERALELAPEDPEVLLVMGEMERARGRPTQAERMFRRAARFGPTSTAGRSAAIQYAGLLLARGQDRLALRFLRRISKRNADHPSVATRLALLEVEAGQVAAAKRRLDRARAQAGLHDWPLLGRAYGLLGERATASRCFRTHFSATTSPSDEFLRWATAHELTFGSKALAGRYLRAMKSATTRALARVDIDRAGAITVLERIDPAAPGGADRTALLARLLADRGDVERAASLAGQVDNDALWLELAIRTGTNETSRSARPVDESDPSRLGLRAADLFAGDRAQEAWPLLERALSMDPDNVLLHRLYIEHAATDRARLSKAHAFARADYLDAPDDPRALAALGSVLLGKGSKERALFFLSRAELRAPSDPEIAELFGDALLAGGRAREASKRYQSALSAWKSMRAATKASPAVQRLETKLRRAS